MLKGRSRNLEFWYTMKCVRTFSGLENSSIYTGSRSIKRPKKITIYHSKDYANIRSFCHQIESGSKGWTPNETYKEAKRLLSIMEVDSGNHSRMDENASENLLALKDFVD